VCGKAPCNICLSHCGTIKPISYADEVLKHPNCTCTFVAAKKKGKVYDKKSYEMVKKTTEIKEYALDAAYNFINNFYNAFKEPLPTEEAIERFKGFFVNEKSFMKHVYKHAIPEPVKKAYSEMLNVDVTSNWEILIRNLPETQLKQFIYQYFLNTLTALAHPSRMFYELPNSPTAEPVITIYSGYKKWFCVTLKGSKLLSSYSINRAIYKSIKEWIERRKMLTQEESILKFFLEVGINERIREAANKLQDAIKHYER